MCDGFGKFTCRNIEVASNKIKFLSCDIATMRKCHELYFKGKPTELELK